MMQDMRHIWVKTIYKTILKLKNIKQNQIEIQNAILESILTTLTLDTRISPNSRLYYPTIPPKHVHNTKKEGNHKFLVLEDCYRWFSPVYILIAHILTYLHIDAAFSDTFFHFSFFSSLLTLQRTFHGT